ncbi:MAG: hypothetical protein ACRBK7_25880 [Acidimicrobiales bacterium]
MSAEADGTRQAVPEVGVTVEGRWLRKAVAVMAVAVLAVAGFAVGHGVSRLEAGRAGGQGLTDAAAPASSSLPTDPNPSTATSEAVVPAVGQPVVADEPPIIRVAEPAQTLRFEAFDETTTLIDGQTDPELNNSIGLDIAGLDIAGLGIPDAKAVIADLVVKGPQGVTVSVHPGDRPADALRFTVPSSGRLLVPHLVATPDEYGRIVVSAGEQVTVQMSGIGTYVPADLATAGRFVPTGSIRIGSLVTATDGRQLTIALSEVLGDEADHVGRAVIRMNANVSPSGGSVAIGSDAPIPWPAPATQDFGLAGTELLTVTPDENGEIVMDYLGGSVLTIDLVGYYTNGNAPESTEGLFVLAAKPEYRTIDVGDVDVTVENDWAALLEGGEIGPEVSRAIIMVDAVNGQNGGSFATWQDGDSVPTSPAFALAPNQGRGSSEWFNPASGLATIIRAPEGAVLNLWFVGAYT